jgi:hypothetical protein
METPEFPEEAVSKAAWELQLGLDCPIPQFNYAAAAETFLAELRKHGWVCDLPAIPPHI